MSADVLAGVRDGVGARHSARRLPARLSARVPWPYRRRRASSAPVSSSPSGCATSAWTPACPRRALSAAAGWHKAKTSRIESAKQAPSEDDIRAWCRVCGAERDVPDLIAASRAADSMYIEWRRLNAPGCATCRSRARPLYERTRLFKAYCPSVVPGLLQTPGYATALLSAITAFRGTPDDVARPSRRG